MPQRSAWVRGAEYHFSRLLGNLGEAGEAGGWPVALSYYGGTAGGGPPPTQQTSVAIGAGKQLVFTVSGGNAAGGISGTPGFQGYIVALCQFQYAVGYATITDGFGGIPTLAEGYLAQVIGGYPGGRKPE